MKKVIVVAGLAVLAIAVAPVASASAAELKGECTIEGVATFGHALSPKALQNTYKFTSTSVKCAGLNGTTPETGVTGAAEVSGAGQLSCAVSNGALQTPAGAVTGAGKITLSNGAAVEGFEFKFTAAGAAVKFAISGGSGGGATAAGEAQFATKGGAAAAEKCAKEEATELPFEAHTVGTIG
jgi:hypothetical protein